MKNFISLFTPKKLVTFFLVHFMLTTLSFGAQIAFDDFVNDLDGWTGANIWHDSWWQEMGISRDATASKTYTFGASHANESITIVFKAWTPSSWDEDNDRLRVRINGSVVRSYEYEDGGGNTETLSATLDANGDITLSFNPDTTRDNEYATIEYITIDTKDTGCDNSLDTNANSSAPWTIIPQMHLITASTSTCISGSTAQSDGSPQKTDVYYFTVDIDGTLNVNASSPNNHSYKLSIGNGGTGNEYYGLTISRTHNKSINLSAGDTVSFYFRESGNNEDLYEMNLAFIADVPTPPVANAGPNQSIISGSPITVDGSGSSDIDGSIVSYIWTDDGNIVGTGVSPTFGLTGTGVHTILLTVTDDDNLTSSDTMIITLTAQPLDAINDTFATVEDINITRNFISNDKGMNVVYTSLVTPPSDGTVVISSNGLFTYTPDASFTGSDSFTYQVTDDSGSTDTAIVTISVNSRIAQNFRDFSLRYQSSLAGNIITIGNTILVAPTPNNANCNTYTNGSFINDAPNRNDQYRLCKYFADTNETFSTTTAKLTLPTPKSRIVWAGLYWQALVSNTDARSPSNNPNMAIKIKHENDSTYETIGYDQLDWVPAIQTGGNHDGYAAFKDITHLFRTKTNWHTAGHMYVGDVPIHENAAVGDAGGLGTYGAWTLVVVYDDKTQSIKNFSVYDGYKSINAANNPSDTISISGFKTPKSISDDKPMKSTLSIFVAEGDKNILNDSLTVQPSLQSSPTTLSYDANNNPFFSVIQTPISFERTPSPINNQGIDIQAFNLGASGENIIKPNETSIDIVLGSSQDTYFPSMVAFATDLHVPSLCYDYVVQKNDYTLSANDDRNFTTYGSGKVSIAIAIRSEEGDFDLKHTHIKVNLDVRGTASFENALYSPNSVNTLIDAVYFEDNSTRPDIAVGQNANKHGGTVSRLQRYFTQFNYLQSSSVLDGHFDFDLNTTIDFGSGPVQYKYSTNTREGGLPISQCNEYIAYKPIWGQFNIERSDNHTATTPNTRFPLYTQITGRDFHFSVVAYDANASPAYSQPLAITEEMTVEVELIDVKPFNDNAFKCSSTLSSIVQRVSEDNNKSFFVTFDGTGTSRVDVTKPNDLVTEKALESAAFRMWLLVDVNNSIINHTCKEPTKTTVNDTCYKDEVGSKIYDPLNKCPDTNCSSYVSPNDPSRTGCYACYRDFSAIAVCSRDNFSIRPETYILDITDTNDTNGTIGHKLRSNDTLDPISLAAEYKYKFGGKATRFDSNETALAYQGKKDIILDFNNPGTCVDDNDTNTTYFFNNGVIIAGDTHTNVPKFAHDNVGDYLLRMKDKEWTKVDQRGMVLDEDGKDLKTFPTNDCNRDNGDTSTDGNTYSGCDIKSDFDASHTDIALTFEPYRFDVSNVRLTLLPDNSVNFLLMNDLSYYDDPADANMTARIHGPIVALGADGGRLSNYTGTCHAIDKNISLILERNTLPTAEKNLSSLGLCSSPVNFQQILDMKNVPDSAVEGYDKNVTLSGLEFEFSDEGNASIILNTTFKKPIRNTKNVINPIDMNYSWFIARDTDTNYYADLTEKSPEGEQLLDRRIIYYFAKLTPEKRVYGPTSDNFMNTPVSTDIYCSFDTNNTCRDMFDLNDSSHSQEESAGWYAATMYQPSASAIAGTHMPNDALGLFDLQVGTVYGSDASPRISAGLLSTNTDHIEIDVPFEHADGSQDEINVSVAGPARPSTVEVIVTPEPFLRYSNDVSKKDYSSGGGGSGTPGCESGDIGDAEGLLRYRVIFVGDSIWSGEGSVGNAVGTSANPLDTGRMTW